MSEDNPDPTKQAALSLPYTRGYDRVIIDSKDLAQTGGVNDENLLKACSHIMNRPIESIRHRLEFLTALDEDQAKRIRQARYPSTIDWESLFMFLSDKDWDALKASPNSREDVWQKFDKMEDMSVLHHVYNGQSLQDAIELLGREFPHRLKRNWRNRYALLKSQFSPEQLEKRMKSASEKFSATETRAHFARKYPRFYGGASEVDSATIHPSWFDEDDKEDDEGDADGPQTSFTSAQDKFILEAAALCDRQRVSEHVLLKLLEFVLSVGPFTLRKHLNELRQETEMVTLALRESLLPVQVNWPAFEAAAAGLGETSTTSDIDWPAVVASVTWPADETSDVIKAPFTSDEDRCLMAHLEVGATIFDGARAVHRKYPHRNVEQWHKRYYTVLGEQGSLGYIMRDAAFQFSEEDCEKTFLKAYPEHYTMVEGKFKSTADTGDSGDPGSQSSVAAEVARAAEAQVAGEQLFGHNEQNDESHQNMGRPAPPTFADPPKYDTSNFTRTQDKVIYAANKTATENNVTVEVLVQTVSYVLNRDPEVVRRRLLAITTEFSSDEIARLQRHNYPYGIDWNQIKQFLISAKSKSKDSVDWNELYTRSRAFNVKKRLDDKEKKALLAIVHSEPTVNAAMIKLHSLYPHRSRHAWSDSWRILKVKPNFSEEVDQAILQYDHLEYKEHFTRTFPEYYGAKEVVRTVVDNNHNPKGKPRQEGSRYPRKPLKGAALAAAAAAAAAANSSAAGAPDEPNASSDKTLPSAVAAATPSKPKRKKGNKVLKDEAEQLRAEDLIRSVVQEAVDRGNVDPADPAAADGLRPRKRRRAAANIGSLAEPEIDEEPEALRHHHQDQHQSSQDIEMLNMTVDEELNRHVHNGELVMNPENTINEEDLMRAVQNATNAVEDHSMMLEPNAVDVAVAAVGAAMNHKHHEDDHQDHDAQADHNDESGMDHTDYGADVKPDLEEQEHTQAAAAQESHAEMSEKQARLARERDEAFVPSDGEEEEEEDEEEEE